MKVITHNTQFGYVDCCLAHSETSKDIYAAGGFGAYLGVSHGLHDGECDHPDCRPGRHDRREAARRDHAIALARQAVSEPHLHQIDAIVARVDAARAAVCGVGFVDPCHECDDRRASLADIERHAMSIIARLLIGRTARDDRD